MVLIGKCENYREMKRFTMQFIEEGKSGENLMYQKIYRKYEKFAKLAFVRTNFPK